MPYDYDVFISYSSADRPWALKLFDDLSARNVKVFFDQNRLDVGKPWEPQLAKAVQSSQHLVVLWSNNADASQWVRREVSYFETLNDPALPQSTGDSRRYAFILMEGENRAYSTAQAIGLLKDVNAYQPALADKGAAAVNAGQWQQVIAKIDELIQEDGPFVPVPLAVLSMTRADLQGLDPTKEMEFGPRMNTLLQSLGMGTRDDLLPYYGAKRTDWRPFQDALSVRQILDNMLADINAAIADPQFRFRWQPILDDFWTNDFDAARLERDKLLSRLSVIVIDPLSLYDDRVLSRLRLLGECFKSDRVVIMALTPFSMPQSIIDLSTLLEQRGSPMFDSYWNPPVPYVNTSAKLGVNLGFARDVRRLLRSSLGQYVRQNNLQGGSPYPRQ
jgi:hypothetical protein